MTTYWAHHESCCVMIALNEHEAKELAEQGCDEIDNEMFKQLIADGYSHA